MAITILRPNQEFTVKANVTRGDTQLVSWIIFSGHNSESMNILQFYPKNGVELNHHFPDEGKFRMAAYHKEIQTKEDFQGSAELKHVDVEIKYNQLDGSKLAPKNSGEFLAGDALRKDFPAVFEAKFLISPPSQEEINRLQFVLEDGSGNILNEGSQASNVFTFIPRNSNAKYAVKAIYTKESGETSQQTFSGISKAISVRDITHGAEIVRPGTPMTFSVTQTQFGSVSSNSNFPEQGNIKWNLDKVLIGTGRSVTISGSQLMQKKKYHIEAYATSAIGNTKGSNTDNTKNDWHFEVKDNIVENIKVVKKPKFGIEGEFEIGKMTFPNYDAAKDGNISWKITGPENGSGSEAKLKKLFSVPGEYTISCSLGGRECKEPLKINILQPEVTANKCKWIDRDNGSGNIIKEAGINQEVCAFVSGNALDNENLTLTVYDDDSTGRTSVYNMTFSTEDKHKTGFYLPITISQDVVDGIKKAGFADYGDLYFNIVRNGSELQVKNGDKKLGEFLRVSLEPKIINAYFCDANDTQQLFNSPLNGALYFKIYAINLVGRKAEINFVTESDAYWSWDDEMKIGPWEDIKNKFKNERIRDTKPGTFNEKGEILVPVDLSKMGKPKNFIRLNAMVKILPDENAKEKQEEKGFYMEYTNLAILFPGATLPTIAENKGAVKVGRENIDGGGNNCGGKFCIKKGSPKSELIREINIRLAGFGGNVPTDEFTDRTEKMVKQFQRDYMKVPETGKVCGNVLKAIDEFTAKWAEKVSDYTCLCNGIKSIASKCSGFGKGQYKDQYSSKAHVEKYHKYERPGMHRSLLWGVSALKYYLSIQSEYRYSSITAGYRCWEHNKYVGRDTTNHMGKAVDIQFLKNNKLVGGKKEENLPILRDIRDKFYTKYLDSKYNWVNGNNNFSLEPFGLGKGQTWSWIHTDVREFDNVYLDDKFFIKTQDLLTGKSLTQIANDLGLKDMCSCMGGGVSTNNNSNSTTDGNRVDPKTLRTSQKGKDFIKDWEKYYKMPYDDSEDYATIGYGYLIAYKSYVNVTKADVEKTDVTWKEYQEGISQERALQLFEEKIKKYENSVYRDVTVKLYQHEFDALVSLLFNCGPDFLKNNKAPKLYRNLLAEKYEDAAKEFLDITNDDTEGLVKRRKAENDMFLNNHYDSKH